MSTVGLRNNLPTSTSCCTRNLDRRETARLYFVSTIDHNQSSRVYSATLITKKEMSGRHLVR